MADIELVIKIDEEQYDFIKQSMTMADIKNYPALLYDICDCIKNGISLPKGHGKLKDVDALLRQHPEFNTYPFPSTTIDNAPTVIEADKKEEEG